MTILGGAVLTTLTTLAACAPPGLPPAGPGPGEVEVGYGTQEAEDVTGAVSSVSGKEIGRAQPQGIVELLRGRVAGLHISPRPGGGFRLRIRGTNSMLADVEPLFVVDGVPMSSSDLGTVLSGFAPDDIRQVDVLKDVSSTSIYGMRGAGGVIVITTRR